MRLWLLRHGEAQPQARTDAERPLTDNGRAQALRAAEYLREQPPLTLLVSPYVRAQQTAQLVRDAIGFRGAWHTVPWLTPESELREVLLQLDRFDQGSVLLVTHQPLVGALAGLLIDGHRQQPVPMHTASLAALDGDLLAAGCMTLHSLQHPALE